MFEKNIPIYLQLMDVFKTNIVTGVWAPDAYIDSVRDLAMTYQANPNTVMKALGELESLGLLVTDRTVGKRITSDVKLIQNIKQDMVDDVIKAFLEQSTRLGITKESLIERLMNMENNND